LFSSQVKSFDILFILLWINSSNYCFISHHQRF